MCVSHLYGDGGGARGQGAEEARAAVAGEQSRAFKLEAQVAELRQALSRTSDTDRDLQARPDCRPPPHTRTHVPRIPPPLPDTPPHAAALRLRPRTVPPCGSCHHQQQNFRVSLR